jgi:RND family efflux transporter MFP subunit
VFSGVAQVEKGHRWFFPRTAMDGCLYRSLSSVAATVLLATGGAAAAADAPGAGTASPVEVAAVRRVDLATGQSFVGTVYPARSSDIGSAVDGRVVELPVREGQAVDAGEPIAELLRGLLEIEQAGSLAELDRLQQVLAELQAGSRPEELEQARADVARLEAADEYARSRFTRIERLVARGTTTTDELQDALAEVRQAEAGLRRSRAALAMSEAGPRVEQIAQAAAAVAVQQAAVDRIEDQLKKHTIRAPFAGWVVERFTEKGEWVARGGLVARVVELDRIEVEVQVPERLVSTLGKGMEVRLEFDAAPTTTWIGSIDHVVPQADLLSRSFPVKVLLDNKLRAGAPVLRGGMLARAWLPVGRVGEALVVPKDAVVLGGPTPIVFAVQSIAGTQTDGSIGMGTVQPVPVRLGAAVGGAVAIEGDLAVGSLVVIRGNERLRPGMPVRFPAPAEASR